MRIQLIFLPTLAVAALSVFGVAVAADEANQVVEFGKKAAPTGALILQAIEGAPTVTVVGNDGTRREAKVDEPLQPGEVINTGSKIAATVAFEQGAQVVISVDSKVEVGNEAEVAGEPRVPSVAVQEGTVRAMVEAFRVPGAPASDAHPVVTGKSHRFLIKTPTAVMGVRGTDFVVSAKGDQLSLHTLTGTVEFAPEMKAFGKAGMVSVAAGEMLAPGGTKSFDSAEFLKSFESQHPQLEKLHKKAEEDFQNGTLKQKFVSARPAQTGDPLKKGDSPDLIEFPGVKKSAKPSSSKH